MRSLFSTWKQDLPASVVVFLVALPLCLGIAVASGAPPIAGVVAGAVGGIIVGWASGSPIGVSGPAAGLTAIVLSAVNDLGAYELFLCAVVLAGLIQVVLGLLKGGIIAYYFPNAVIKGMLAGIGVIILLKQIPHALGYDPDFMGDMAFHQPDDRTTFSVLVEMWDNISLGAVVITLVGLLLAILWERPRITRHRVLSLIPGPLLTVAAGVLLAALFDGHPLLAVGPGHYVDLPDINGLSDLPRPDIAGFSMTKVWTIAFTIAIVASLETLLCVEATDKLDPQRRVTPANRELHAQGLGNVVSGLLGGLPVTQVVVRSTANLHSGGRNKLSSILHGMLLLVCALTIPGLLRTIPLASLAAVLLMVGYKLAKPAHFKAMWRAGIMQFIPFIVTVLGVAFTDLLTGVGLGLAVAIVHILWKNFSTPYHFDPARHREGMPIHIELSEDVTFLNKAGIKRTLGLLPEGANVVIDARRTVELDPDVKEIIDEFIQMAPGRNIHCELVGLRKPRTQSPLDLEQLVRRTAQRVQRAKTSETPTSHR